MKRAGVWVVAGTVVMVVAMVFATAAAANEPGFNTVVKVLETRYGRHHHGIHGLWLAKPFLIGSGVSGLKMAEFRELQVRGYESESLKEELGRTLGTEWAPFIETWERQGEWSVIYAKASGRGMTMLIVTAEPGDTVTLLQVNVSGKAGDKWVNKPVQAARNTNP
jgi:hypothetical protein